jgi:hypothetical protein
MDVKKRQQNERKFGSWKELSGGGRCYWYEVVSRSRWKARYVKEVDSSERTVRFYQEIYNEKGKLVEVHNKLPMDEGHKALKEER